MNKALANWKIGRKLALLLASGIGPAVCVAGVALWGLSAIRGVVDQERTDAEKSILAHHALADMGRVTSIVGHIALGKRCETCHGVATGGDREHQAKIAKEYLLLMDDLKARETNSEGRRLVGEMETALGRWHEIDTRVLQLTNARKQAEAIETYRSEAIPAYAPVQKAVDNYLNWQQPRQAEMKERTQSFTRLMPIVVGVLALSALGLSIFLGLIITRSIAKPLHVAVGHLDQVARGDVSRGVPAEYLERGDEIGMLSKAMQTMSDSLHDVLKEITGGIQVVSSSSGDLSGSSGRMSEGSRKASDRAHSVAAAAEEMSANVTSVAAGMEQASTSLAQVASHTEQMTATIAEIAQNSERARRITEEATRQATHLNDQMSQLGQAAREIGKVTETITEISSQTNLLALNATIEAARAGSAGKGFAVVANEIKELAQQTAAATEDIENRIASVQSSTVGGIAEIEKISRVIHEVRDIVSSIAAAIEEQATVTKDIARNIAEASTGVQDANVRVSEASQATMEIAQEIAIVDQAAGQMAEGSEQVRTSASELSMVAVQLQKLVTRFQM